jgi:hypothetical protein
MIGALIIALVLVIVGIVVYVADRKGRHQLPERVTPKESPGTQSDSEECCGLHEVCEKLYQAPPQQIDYYDDEQLDVLADREPDSFSDDENNMIEEVLLTLRKEDAPGWAESLRRRNIILPAHFRDALLMLINDNMNSAQEAH